MFYREVPGSARQRFVVNNPPHDNISGCTVPTWVDPGTLKLLIDHFAKQLRKELVRLIAHPALEPKSIRRMNSTGSEGFSDSIPASSGESDYSYHVAN